jgi:hypothetical protein
MLPTEMIEEILSYIPTDELLFLINDLEFKEETSILSISQFNNFYQFFLLYKAEQYRDLIQFELGLQRGNIYSLNFSI